MGHIEVTRRWVVERRLVLDDQDYVKRIQRREQRQEEAIQPALFAWHEAFTKRLEKCPHCGRTPELSATWDVKRGYSYKYVCSSYHRGILDCGDWYPQLSRAGLDWNYRVWREKGMPYKHCPHWTVKMDEH